MTTAEKIDFRTKTQIETDERWKKVCDRYTFLHQENPEVKPYRLFVVIAGETSYTVQQIRNIVINKGIYVPKSMKG